MRLVGVGEAAGMAATSLHQSATAVAPEVAYPHHHSVNMCVNGVNGSMM